MAPSHPHPIPIPGPQHPQPGSPPALLQGGPGRGKPLQGWGVWLDLWFFLICEAKPQMLEKKNDDPSQAFPLFLLFFWFFFFCSVFSSFFFLIIAYIWICFRTQMVLVQHEKAKPQHLENAETAHSLCPLLGFFFPLKLLPADFFQTQWFSKLSLNPDGLGSMWDLPSSGGPGGLTQKGAPGEVGDGTPLLWGAGWGPTSPGGGGSLGHSHNGVLGAWKGPSLCSSHIYF